MTGSPRIPLAALTPDLVSRAKPVRWSHAAVVTAGLLIGGVKTDASHAQEASATPKLNLSQSSPSPRGGPPPDPPAEAIEVCAAAEVDAPCTFEGRQGEEVSGACTSTGSGAPLACMPERPPRRG